MLPLAGRPRQDPFIHVNISITHENEQPAWGVRRHDGLPVLLRLSSQSLRGVAFRLAWHSTSRTCIVSCEAWEPLNCAALHLGANAPTNCIATCVCKRAPNCDRPCGHDGSSNRVAVVETSLSACASSCVCNLSLGSNPFRMLADSGDRPIDGCSSFQAYAGYLLAPDGGL